MYKVEVWKRNDAEKLHTEYDFTTIEDAEKYIEEVKENNKKYFVVDDDGNVVISARKLFSYVLRRVIKRCGKQRLYGQHSSSQRYTK